jgi:hypothetical protein
MHPDADPEVVALRKTTAKGKRKEECLGRFTGLVQPMLALRLSPHALFAQS